MPAGDSSRPKTRIDWAWLPWATLILLVAAALRFVALADIPPGLYFDESANGVDALRVIAGWHPVFFPGDQGREALTIYLQAATMALIGPSPMALRLPSAMLGVLTVAVTYATFRAFAGRIVGLIGAALLAGSFWHVMLSRHAFRTDSLPLCIAVAAFWLFKGIRTGQRQAFIIGGAAVGLSLYTYIPARLAPLLFLLWLVGCVVLPAWRPAVTVRQLLAGAGLGGVAGAVVALPLVWYFYRNPGDFYQRLELASGTAAPISLIERLRESMGALVLTGDPYERHDLIGRPLLDVAVTVVGVVGIYLAARRWRQSPFPFTCLWCVAMVFPAALSGQPAHALRLAGELPFIFLFPALALAALASARSTASVRIGAAAVVALLVVSALTTSRDYFVTWANRPLTYDVFQGDLLHSVPLLDRVPRGALILATSDVYEGYVIPESFFPKVAGRERAFNGLDTFVVPRPGQSSVYYLYSRTFMPATGIPIEAYLRPSAVTRDPFGRLDGVLFQMDPPYLTLPADREVGAVIGSAVDATGVDFATTAEPGHTARYALHWTVQGTLPPGNWQFFMHLVDRSQHRLIAQGYNHGFSPEQWRMGDRVVTWFDLAIPSDAPLGVDDLNIGIMNVDTEARLPVTTPSGDSAGNALVAGPIRLVGPTAPLPPAQHPANVLFGSALTLKGYDLDQSSGGPATVRLYWQAAAPVASDYTVFVHLLDAQGRLIAGADSQPGGGQYPTSTWRAGDAFVDEHRVDAPAGATMANIEVGLYLLSTGQRLGAVDVPTGKSLGDAARFPW